MLTLYHFTGATCATKVLLALAEKQIPFEDRLLERTFLSSAEFRALNPNGTVPVITHKGATIIESSVILNYLEDAFTGIGLRPIDAQRRARMNYWLKLVDDSLMDLGTVTYAIFSRAQYLQMSPVERELYYRSIPSFQIRASRRNAIELGLDAPEVPDAVRGLCELQKKAQAMLGDDTYLASTFSLADIALTPFAHRLEALGLLATRAELPGFHRWWDAIRARRSFQEAIVSRIPSALLGNLRAASDSNSAAIAGLRQQSLMAHS
jgi:glutathione S-transferase